MRNLLARLIEDETGAEAVNYAFVLSGVAVATVAVVSTAGSQLSGWWINLADRIGVLLTGT